MNARPALWLLLAALIGAGCGGFVSAPVGPQASQVVQCEGMPPEACNEVVAATGAANRSAIQVFVRCTRAACTVAEGEAQVTLVFRDGQQETSSYAWASAPAAAPPEAPVPAPGLPVQPRCLGVPLELCQDLASGGPNGTGVVDTIASITVRCTAVCTPDGGRGQTFFEFKDGSPAVVHEFGYGGG